MDSQSLREPLRLYFSFNDPYSFIVFGAMKNLAQNYKVNVESHPLGGYDSSGVFSTDEAQAAYWKRDSERFASSAGRKLSYIPQVQDSTMARRGLYMAQEKMLGAKYINLVFALRWLSAGDISDSSQMIKALSYLELKEEGLAAAMKSDMFGQNLAHVEEMAMGDGAIGVPFFRFRGEGFFGAHQLAALEALIRSDPALVIHHDASYGVIPPQELAARLQSGVETLVLDVRIPKEFGAGHIPGANCIPAKVVYRSLEKLEREWSIVVVDDGGVEANETAFLLASEGFKKVSVLSGGFPAWKGSEEKGIEKWHDRLKS
ncbi:MAG: DsbA family protein [Nitrospinota bacterium]|nr:DsbA family protein [Nitrospinota bacterium]